MVAGVWHHREARLLREKLLIHVGMAKGEVKALFDCTGRLKKEPRQYVCVHGHVWDAQLEHATGVCPVCGEPGKKVPETWVLFQRRDVYLGSPYLNIKFDASGRVQSVSTCDM